LIDWWPHYPGSHFFVADAKGHTAAIEIIRGKLKVSVGDKMPLPVLCNGPYQQELATLKRYKTFGGEKIVDYTVADWNTRFIRIAHRLKEYRPETAQSTEFAWKLLDEVNAGTWQLVADVRTRTLYFRSQACNSIKAVNLNQCDFSADSPIKYIDIHINFKGDVASQLAVLTPDINQAYLLAGFPAGYEEEAFYRSEDYKNLIKNLHSYAEKLQQQEKNR